MTSEFVPMFATLVKIASKFELMLDMLVEIALEFVIVF